MPNRQNNNMDEFARTPARNTRYNKKRKYAENEILANILFLTS